MSTLQSAELEGIDDSDPRGPLYFDTQPGIPTRFLVCDRTAVSSVGENTRSVCDLNTCTRM